MGNKTKGFSKINMAFNNYGLKAYYGKLKDIKAFRTDGWSNGQIKDYAITLKEKAQQGVAVNDLIIGAAALVNEVIWRLLGMRLYNSQLVAGLALCDGNIIEMTTGEGKTLAAVLPAYVSALQGKGCHIFTFNDYLASRDAAWMGPVYEYLGLTVGKVKEGQDDRERKAAYAADITYLTAKQAGFDYLRDSLVYDKNRCVQRPFQFVLVDEADSILIDEARVPLVIAGATAPMQNGFEGMTSIVNKLKQGEDYDTDDNKRNVYLTETGTEQAEALLGCGNLYEAENHGMLTELHCALHATALLKRDVHYIVRDGKVQLIDELTGRIAENRHWPDGLQAAVEAKEGITNQPGGIILGTITLQHLLSLYPRICGMTATAQTSADEFKDMYALDVVVIPPNKPCLRMDLPHSIFTHREAKQQAIINEIVTVHAAGRPILVGTGSVEESKQLAADLSDKGISCHVLNAWNDHREAEIIAEAGRLGAVTVSTNMAGRGVDIVLGGGDPAEYAMVANLGGLYVIGTNLHESIRVDNQLRGRAGRQGDKGLSRFMVSLEDDLLLRYGIAGELSLEYQSLRQKQPLTDSRLYRTINHIQRVADGQNLEIKKTLNKYADMVEQQRRMMYNKRRELLNDIVKPDVLAKRIPGRYQQLCRVYGETRVIEAERHVILVQIDKCWAGYLEYVSGIKEGIHLVSLSNRNPLDEYNRMIIQEYEGLDERVKTAVVDFFMTLDLSRETIDLDREEIRTPSATWTYIINDSFFLNRVNLF